MDAVLRSAFHQAPIGMAVVDGFGVVQQVNAALLRLLDRPDGSVLGQPLLVHLHPEDVDGAVAACTALRERPEAIQRHDCRFTRPDGRLVAVTVTSSSVVVDAVPDGDLEEEPRRVVLHVEDVTERLALQQELRRLALHDPLTGLANRSLLLEHLQQALAAHARSARPVAVLFLDLDGFKGVNDSHGHAGGDAELRAVGDRLRRQLRAQDVAARFGGDELVAACQDLPAPEALALRDRLRSVLEQPVRHGDALIDVGVSIGLAVAGPAHTSAEQLLHDADRAMYVDKEQARRPRAG